MTTPNIKDALWQCINCNETIRHVWVDNTWKGTCSCGTTSFPPQPVYETVAHKVARRCAQIAMSREFTSPLNDYERGLTDGALATREEILREFGLLNE